MKKVVIALLTIGVVVSIASVSAIAQSSGSETNTTDIARIANSPSELDGQEVTVEGWVAATFDHWFVLLGDDGASITVKCVGDMPIGGEADRVSVTGTVGTEKLFGNKQAYVFARSWEYVD